MGRHLKRLAVPTAWHIPRKTNVWVARVNPGPHPKERSLPLAIIVRDILKLCDNMREAKAIITGRNVMVDGRVVTDIRFPVGLMDKLTLLKSDEHYMMVINRQGKILPVPIDKGESKWKIVRIEGKRKIRGGKFQINTHDGRCMVMEECKYRPNDVLKLEIPNQKILGYIPFAKDSIGYIIGGSHVGEIGHIEGVNIIRSSLPNTVRFKEGFSTTMDKVFVIGTARPLINLDVLTQNTEKTSIEDKKEEGEQ